MKNLSRIVADMVDDPSLLLTLDDAVLDSIAEHSRTFAHQAPLLHMMRARYLRDEGESVAAYDEVEKAEDEIYRILRDPAHHDHAVFVACNDLLDDVIKALKAGVPHREAVAQTTERHRERLQK